MTESWQVCNRLYNFLADHNIISKKQYGFKENYSTYMAIIDLVDKISSNIDNKVHRGKVHKRYQVGKAICSQKI